MGIPGLTTFLDQYSTTKYASSIWLTDCTVIVDGFNAAFFLYHQKKEPNAHKVGGDYFGFAKNVREFFQHLKNAKIYPIVVFDGAHEPEKFHTINERFRQCIVDNVKSVYNQPTSGYVPVGLKAAFMEVLDEQKVFHVQSFCEADDTIAFLSENLNAPVLSSDSDFQVYVGVTLAIPFQKIVFKNTVKDGQRVFALHAKIVNLKVLCRELHKFSEEQLEIMPFLGLAFGNDKCTILAFRNLFPGVSSTERFDLFLKFVLKQTCLKEFGIALMRESGIRNPNVDKQTKAYASPAPVTANFSRVLNSYVGHNKDPSVWHLVEIHCKGIFKQTIEVNRCKISVVRKEDLYFEKQNLATAVEKLQKLERNLLVSKSYPQVEVPGWFMADIRNCELSTEVLDMMRNQKIWLWPQAETTSHRPSQQIAIPILQVIAGLLGCEDEIEVISRSGLSPDTQNIKPKLDLPNVGTLPKFFEEGFRKKGALIFLATFGCEKFEDFITEWPTHSRFAVITLLFFLRERPQCSAIAVGVLLSILKSNIQSNGKKEEQEEEAQETPPTADDDKISTVLKTQKMSKDLRSIYSMAERTDKLGTYELERVYHYCEYKAIFAHAKTLNVLLGNPFKVPKITSLNSYIVYHIHEAASTKCFDHAARFIKQHLPKDPMGKILLRFIEFSEGSTPVKTKSKNIVKVKDSKVQAARNKLGQLKI